MDLEGWPRYKMSCVKGTRLPESPTVAQPPLPSFRTAPQARWRPLCPGLLWHFPCEQIPALWCFYLWATGHVALMRRSQLGWWFWGIYFPTHVSSRRKALLCNWRVVTEPQSLTGEPLLAMQGWFPAIDMVVSFPMVDFTVTFDHGFCGGGESKNEGSSMGRLVCAQADSNRWVMVYVQDGISTPMPGTMTVFTETSTQAGEGGWPEDQNVLSPWDLGFSQSEGQHSQEEVPHKWVLCRNQVKPAGCKCLYSITDDTSNWSGKTKAIPDS